MKWNDRKSLPDRNKHTHRVSSFIRYCLSSTGNSGFNEDGFPVKLHSWCSRLCFSVTNSVIHDHAAGTAADAGQARVFTCSDHECGHGRLHAIRYLKRYSSFRIAVSTPGAFTAWRFRFYPSFVSWNNTFVHIPLIPSMMKAAATVRRLCVALKIGNSWTMFVLWCHEAASN